MTAAPGGGCGHSRARAFWPHMRTRGATGCESISTVHVGCVDDDLWGGTTHYRSTSHSFGCLLAAVELMLWRGTI